MTQREELLRYILDHPADNVVRLAYADNLQESGKPWDVAHAELIRLQVNRLDASPREVSDSLRREERILKKYGAKWLPPVARWDRGERGWYVHGDQIDFPYTIATHVRYTFERGFVATVMSECDENARSNEAIGDFVRECLAHRPVHTFGFLVTNHAPNLTLSVEPYKVAPRWVATLTDADDPQSFSEEYIASDRKTFVAGIVGWLKMSLAEIEFERYHEYEDAADYL